MAEQLTPSRSKVGAKRPHVPPSTLDELRSLLVDITRGQSDIVLGKKAHDALGQILDLNSSHDLLSITTLAERVGTNPSTITRLARSLGYQNFVAFQKALFAREPQARSGFYLKQAQTAFAEGDQPIEQKAVRLCRENQVNIDRFLENFDADSFDKAVRLVAEACRVTVFGIRQFHSLAAFLTYGLRLIRSDVSVLDADALGLAEELGAMQKGDVCIVASVAPYSSIVVRVSETAASKGLRVVAFTDRASSPLVAHCEAAIFAPNDSSFISNSVTSYFAAAECLINAVAATAPEESRSALVKRMALINQLKIEDE